MKALAIIAALLIAVLPVRGDGEALLSAVYGAWSQSAGGGGGDLPEWMPSNCVAYYPMTDATSELCPDATGNGWDLYCTNAVKPTVVDGVATFLSWDTHWKLNDSVIVGAQDWSISFWARVGANDAEWNGAVGCMQTSLGPGTSYLSFRNASIANSRIILWYYNAKSDSYYPGVPLTNKWVHVVMIHQESTKQFAIDTYGVRAGGLVGGNTANAENPIYNFQIGLGIAGEIDDVIIFDRLLDVSESASIFAATSNNYPGPYAMP